MTTDDPCNSSHIGFYMLVGLMSNFQHDRVLILSASQCVPLCTSNGITTDIAHMPVYLQDLAAIDRKIIDRISIGMEVSLMKKMPAAASMDEILSHPQFTGLMLQPRIVFDIF